MRWMAPVALLVLLAGCAQPAAPPSSSSASSSSPTSLADMDAPCPPARRNPPNAWEAPEWRVGDSWNYTTWRGDEAEGWENHTVVAVGPVGQVSACAYHVQVRTASRYGSDEAHPGGGAVNTGIRTYDARTLHTVWDEGTPCPMEECSGDAAWPYDFPLHDGKTWTYTSGGDVPFEVEAGVALRGFKDTLRLNVIHVDTTGIGRGETYRYAPRIGNAVAWEWTDGGDVLERKALAAYRFQAAEGVVY